MSRISVITVSRNRLTQLRDSLAALGTDYQLIVVDNGSGGAVLELEKEFPNVQFIRLPKNFGLTKSLNLGIRAADGEYILFLHDDTRITASGVAELADVLEAHPEVGAVAPLLVDSLGHPTPQVYADPPDPVLSPIETQTDSDVPAVSGAALMVRAFFLKAMRQIDERYGNWGSDLDICAQVQHRANKKVRVVQSVRAVHESKPESSTLLTADRTIGTSVYLGKYKGAMAGWKHRISNVLSAIVTVRLPLLKHLMSNQKLDGTQ